MILKFLPNRLDFVRYTLRKTTPRFKTPQSRLVHSTITSISISTDSLGYPQMSTNPNPKCGVKRISDDIGGIAEQVSKTVFHQLDKEAPLIGLFWGVILFYIIQLLSTRGRYMRMPSEVQLLTYLWAMISKSIISSCLDLSSRFVVFSGVPSNMGKKYRLEKR